MFTNSNFKIAFGLSIIGSITAMLCYVVAAKSHAMKNSSHAMQEASQK